MGRRSVAALAALVLLAGAVFGLSIAGMLTSQCRGARRQYDALAAVIDAATDTRRVPAQYERPVLELRDRLHAAQGARPRC